MIFATNEAHCLKIARNKGPLIGYNAHAKCTCQLYKLFVIARLHNTTGCPIQPVVKHNRLHTVNKHPTGCTTGWMFIYTIQSVVQPVVQPVGQPVVLCKWGTVSQKKGATLSMAITLSILDWFPKKNRSRIDKVIAMDRVAPLFWLTV